MYTVYPLPISAPRPPLKHGRVSTAHTPATIRPPWAPTPLRPDSMLKCHALPTNCDRKKLTSITAPHQHEIAARPTTGTAQLLARVAQTLGQAWIAAAGLLRWPPPQLLVEQCNLPHPRLHVLCLLRIRKSFSGLRCRVWLGGGRLRSVGIASFDQIRRQRLSPGVGVLLGRPYCGGEGGECGVWVKVV